MEALKINFWEKHNLTIPEACVYFSIGENTMRSLVNSKPQPEYVLKVGSKALIKKEVFGKYIDSLYSIV